MAPPLSPSRRCLGGRWRAVAAAACIVLAGVPLHGIEARLAKFKLPKRVLFVDELPRNTMGKVQKNLLRDRFADLYRA